MTDKADFYLVTPSMPLQAPGIHNEITELSSLAESKGYDRLLDHPSRTIAMLSQWRLKWSWPQRGLELEQTL